MVQYIYNIYILNVYWMYIEYIKTFHFGTLKSKLQNMVKYTMNIHWISLCNTKMKRFWSITIKNIQESLLQNMVQYILNVYILNTYILNVHWMYIEYIKTFHFGTLKANCKAWCNTYLISTYWMSIECIEYIKTFHFGTLKANCKTWCNTNLISTYLMYWIYKNVSFWYS